MRRRNKERPEAALYRSPAFLTGRRESRARPAAWRRLVGLQGRGQKTKEESSPDGQQPGKNVSGKAPTHFSPACGLKGQGSLNAVKGNPPRGGAGGARTLDSSFSGARGVRERRRRWTTQDAARGGTPGGSGPPVWACGPERASSKQARAGGRGWPRPARPPKRTASNTGEEGAFYRSGKGKPLILYC